MKKYSISLITTICETFAPITRISLILASLILGPINATEEFVAKLVDELEILRAQKLSLQEHLETLRSQKEESDFNAASALSLAQEEKGEEKREEITRLREELTQKTAELRMELSKELTTKVALMRTLHALGEEQKEAKELIADLLRQAAPPEPLPLESETPQTTSETPKTLGETPKETPKETETETPKTPQTLMTPTLSAFQEQLLKRRNLNQIGDQAWTMLGNPNTSLAQALFSAIQYYPNKPIEIFYLGHNNFSLRVDGFRQSYLYKY